MTASERPPAGAPSGEDPPHRDPATGGDRVAAEGRRADEEDLRAADEPHYTARAAGAPADAEGAPTRDERQEDSGRRRRSGE